MQIIHRHDTTLSPEAREQYLSIIYRSCLAALQAGMAAGYVYIRQPT